MTEPSPSTRTPQSLCHIIFCITVTSDWFCNHINWGWCSFMLISHLYPAHSLSLSLIWWSMLRCVHWDYCQRNLACRGLVWYQAYVWSAHLFYLVMERRWELHEISFIMWLLKHAVSHSSGQALTLCLSGLPQWPVSHSTEMISSQTKPCARH